MRPPTARELLSIDANIESAWRFSLKRDAQNLDLGIANNEPFRTEALFAIAHALIALAQCARIAIAERTPEVGKVPKSISHGDPE